MKDTVTLDFGDFAREFDGVTFEVWVGSSDRWAFAAHLERLADIQEEASSDISALALGQIDDATFASRHQWREQRVMAWLSRSWTNWSFDEVQQMWKHLSQVCPLALQWLFCRTWGIIDRYWYGGGEIICRPGMASTSWWKAQGTAFTAGSEAIQTESLPAVVLKLPARDERKRRV